MLSRMMGVSGDVLTSLREGTPIKRDDILSTAGSSPRLEPNVRLIRQKLGLNVQDFARRFRLSPDDVRNWEEGMPIDTVARTLLVAIATDPTVIDDAVRAGDVTDR